MALHPPNLTGMEMPTAALNTPIALGPVKPTAIQREKDHWDITITTTVGGVPFTGNYRVYPADVSEWWFDPTDRNVTINDHEDDSIRCALNNEILWTATDEEFWSVIVEAREEAARIADALELDVNMYMASRIRELTGTN